MPCGDPRMNLTMDRMADEAKFLEKASRLNKLPAMETVNFDMPPRFKDNVNHPPHYNNSNAKCACGRRIECIDVTRHLSFNIGNAMKYLWRCELKGKTLEDLQKAAWYIQDEINKRSM